MTTPLEASIVPGLFEVRLDVDGQDRLEIVVEEMQAANPELTVDDCIDAIFAIGLISTHSTLNVMTALLPGAPE